MIYLISHLFGWLLLTTAFAALAGWAFASQRAAASEQSLRRDRDNLLRDLSRLASHEEGASSDAQAREIETDTLRRSAELRDGRIVELERVLERARERAADLAGEVSELKQKLERAEATPSSVQALVAVGDDVEDAEVVADTSDAEEQAALQAWHLRYFEQRVQYLETRARDAAVSVLPVAPSVDAASPIEDWRLRDAEARAAHLADELRALREAPPTPVAQETPFAADADVDMLLRWRLLYLERRVAHFQAQAAARPAEPVAQTVAAIDQVAPDPDRWKWRARYLEARVRHFEQRAAAQPAPQPFVAPVVEEVDVEEAPARTAPSRRGVKPSVLASARHGGPDDLTLIDEISLMQQTTLYSLGIFHYDQIAGWSADNVAWIDNFLRLGGRIDEEGWIEQAETLAREGPESARRLADTETT